MCAATCFLGLDLVMYKNITQGSPVLRRIGDGGSPILPDTALTLDLSRSRPANAEVDGPIVWAYGDTMHVQKNNPIGTRGTCVYKGPTLWGSDAQIEDQSYEHTMHVQSSILWTLHVRSYTYLCTCESSMSGTKNHLYGKPNLHKEEFVIGVIFVRTFVPVLILCVPLDWSFVLAYTVHCVHHCIHACGKQ